MIRQGLWHLSAKAFTVVVLGLIFYRVSHQMFVEAEALWHAALIPVVGR